MSASLVGSEMCIRDRPSRIADSTPAVGVSSSAVAIGCAGCWCACGAACSSLVRGVHGPLGALRDRLSSLRALQVFCFVTSIA
eukprot:12091843-Alexandrium_andersonii.AAC.1